MASGGVLMVAFLNLVILHSYNQLSEATVIKSRIPYDDYEEYSHIRAKRGATSSSESIPVSRHTCVVGAGISGLCAARHLAHAGENFTVFEATAHVGGTWRYDPHVGADSHGNPVHSSMYKHLRTNLPKQMMEMPGFPQPADMVSFPTATKYYDYILSFADHFDLKKHVKHEVTAISRIDGNWQLNHRNIVTGEETKEKCDYVIIGIGHFSKPKMPNNPGEDLFKGTIIHSHDFRDAEHYRNRRVLVVGAGPSGIDIAYLLSEAASKVVHSHHSLYLNQRNFPENHVLKPDVRELRENGVVFVDGSFEEIDDVVYCTGYKRRFQLDVSSIKPRTAPLYRGIVNIYNPTMLLLGEDVDSVGLDPQAQYAVAVVTGKFHLPSEQDMRNDAEYQESIVRSQAAKQIIDLQAMAIRETQYYANLTAEAGIPLVPPVLMSLRKAVVETAVYNYRAYRNFEYTVLNEQNFTRTYRPAGGNA